jgi:5-methylcytosine-specific restriction endonuclease McrA
MRTLIFLLIAACFFSADAEARRSGAARRHFAKIHACPSTGAHKASCPGYQIDHIVPLKCGGADAVYNMQWLTVTAHHEKTRREAGLCLKPRKKKSKPGTRRQAGSPLPVIPKGEGPME